MPLHGKKPESIRRMYVFSSIEEKKLKLHEKEQEHCNRYAIRMHDRTLHASPYLLCSMD